MTTVRLRFFLVAAMLVIAAASARTAAAPENAAPLTIAILNFDNLGQGNAEWDWLGKGLADLVIGDLASQGLKVVSREQMQEMIHELKLKKQQVDPRHVASVLKAVRCVHGTYRVHNGKAQLNGSILEVVTGKQLHAASIEGAASELLTLQKKLSAELADVLKGNRVGTLDPAKMPKWTESLKGSQLLYQGIDLFDKGEFLPAWGLFRRALQLDPKYADGRYWSGRMMYYVQEYHQARVDLERFCIEHPKHQRVGDAVMEIINAAQLTAVDAEEVLRVLAFAAELAPTAEVANQFGSGYSSTVGLYTAGIAAQTLRAEGRYREAFERFNEQIQKIPVDHSLRVPPGGLKASQGKLRNLIPHNHLLYWLVWHEMFSVRLRHLKASGELLRMPPMLPSLLSLSDTAPGSLHPGTMWQTGLGAVDAPVRQEFVLLTTDKASWEGDFAKEPLRPPQRYSYTRYFHVDQQHYLTGLNMEVRYRTEPGTNYEGHLEGDVSTPTFVPLRVDGVWRQSFALSPGTRAVGLRLHMRPSEWQLKPTGGWEPVKPGPGNVAILSWKATARIRKYEKPPATLILHAPAHVDFKARLDDQAIGENVQGSGDLTLINGTTRVTGLPPGRHRLQVAPHIWGANRTIENTLDLEPGGVAELALSAQVDPRRSGARSGSPRPWVTAQISTAIAPCTLTGQMGQRVGSGDVCFCEDRLGRWIVVWNLRRDLYMTSSPDRGKSWSATVRLPVPVNTAHFEGLPRLMQDRDGRYVLSFVSDRNLLRTQSMYVSWSDDLVNFSAPVMVQPDPAMPSHIFQRSDGTYLAFVRFVRDRQAPALGPTDQWMVCTSTDLVHWSRPHTLFPATRALAVAEFGGRYLAFSDSRKLNASELELRTSEDGVHFSPPISLPYIYQKLVQGKMVTYNLHPFPIVCQPARDGLLVYAAGLSGGGILFRLSGDRQWAQVATLEQRHSAPSLVHGDFSLSNERIVYFSLPDSFFLPFLHGIPQEPPWYSLGQPLYMNWYEFNSKPLGPDDAEADVVPEVSIKKYSSAEDRQKETVTIPIFGTRKEREPPPRSVKPADPAHKPIIIDREVRRFDGHSRPERGMAVSADGQRLLTSSRKDFSPRLWNLDTGNELGRLDGHIGPIVTLAMSADGTRAVSSGGIARAKGNDVEYVDFAVRVWDLEKRREIARFAGHPKMVRSVAISADKRVALSCGIDNTVRLWELDTGRELKCLERRANIQQVELLPDGNRALFAQGHLLILWDFKADREIRRFTHKSFIHCLAVSTDGRQVICGCGFMDVKAGLTECIAYVGNLEDNTAPLPLPHTAPVYAVCFAPDGRHVLTSSSATKEHLLRLWNIESGNEVVRMQGHEHAIFTVALTPDGKAISCSMDLSTRVWQLPRLK